MMNDYKELIGDIGDCLISQPSEAVYKRVLREAADAIIQLVKERDAAVDDLEKRLYYAQPKMSEQKNITALIFDRGKDKEPSRYKAVTKFQFLDHGIVQLTFDNGMDLITSWENVILMIKERRKNYED